MKAVIGNSLIAKLKPKGKQYDVRDANLKGFLIRVTPAGKMSYVCQYQRGKRINIGQVGVLTPAQARDKAKQILSQAVMGVLSLKEKKSQKITLNNFLNNEYESWRLANRKDGKNDLRRLRTNFCKEFGDLLLKDISPILIEKWRTNRLNDGVRSVTINRDVVILKSALSKAVEWALITDHPLRNLKPFKADSAAKVRFLSVKEEDDLLQALFARDDVIKKKRDSGNQWRKDRGQDILCDLQQFEYADYLTPMVLLSLNTGLRRGELFFLQWSDVDFANAVLTVNGSSAKSGKTRHVPLNVVALGVLQRWNKINEVEKYVFCNTRTGAVFSHVKKSWAGVLEKAEIQNFRWHDMRHHFASKLVMAGVDLNTVRELLGHADIKMTLRYAHLAPEHKANAVAKLVRSKESVVA